MDSVAVDSLLAWIVSRLEALGVSVNSTSDDIKVLIDFVTGDVPKVLSILRSSSTPNGYEITCGNQVKLPSVSIPLYAYFIKSNSGQLDIKSINKDVQYGTVGSQGLSIAAFERLMKGVVEKSLTQNSSSLTENARYELQGHFHRCMANLIDAMYYKSAR
jgi:hypothetical protein